MALSSGIWVGGKYRIERALGEGGMGFVYEASHVKLGAKVAIKLLREEILRVPGVRERFFREASVSARIVHPRVARVTDVDEDPQLGPYMVMDLLRGENLGDVLGRGVRVDSTTLAVLLDQVLEGLAAAHALGVVHRDLKPENVFLVGGLQARDVRIIDFGIAKVKDAAGQALTAAGTLMGTAEYMAPEQVRSAANVDGRADLYSVGVMAYELLTQVRPFEGLDPVRASLRSERGEWTKLDALRPDLSPDWVSWVHCAMAAAPAERFASAEAMRAALLHLQRASVAPVAARPEARPLQAEVNPRANTVLDVSGEQKTRAYAEVPAPAPAPARVAVPPPAQSVPAPAPYIPPARAPEASRGQARAGAGASRLPLVLLLLGGAGVAAGAAYALLGSSGPSPVPAVSPASAAVSAAAPSPVSPAAVAPAALPSPASDSLPSLGAPVGAAPPAPASGVRPSNSLGRNDAGGALQSDAGTSSPALPFNTVVPPIQLPPMPKSLEELQKSMPGLPQIPGFPAPAPSSKPTEPAPETQPE